MAALLKSSALLALALAIAHAQEPARLVKDINREPQAIPAEFGELTPVHGGVVFRMTTKEHGQELWGSDGSKRGTRMLADIEPGPEGSFPGAFVPAGGKAFFLARQQVWVTDGTTEGTRQLTDSSDVYRNLLGAAGDRAIFSADSMDGDGVNRAVWSTDGTVAGTVRLVDSDTTGESSYFWGFDSDGTHAWFFVTDEETSHTDLWRTDGTEAGTTRQRNVYPDANFFPWYTMKVGPEEVITTGLIDSEWFDLQAIPHDGGPAVKLAPFEGDPWPFPPQLERAGDRWLFVPPVENAPLQTTDGTVEGTMTITTIPAGTISQIAAWNDEVAVTSARPDGGFDLWLTDGTEAGTRRIENFPGLAENPVLQTRDEEFLWLQVKGEDQIWSLWRTDGSAWNARRVCSLEQEYLYYSYGTGVVPSGNQVFFVHGSEGRDAVLGRLRGKAKQVAKLTVPERGTASAFDFQSVIPLPGGKAAEALLLPMVAGREVELWRTGGKGRATRAVWIPPVRLGDYGFASFAGNTRGKALFWLVDGMTAVKQLWSTDGTRKGTRLAHDFSADPRVSHGGNLIEVGGSAVFPVYFSDSQSSALWRTDGTAEGTGPLGNPAGVVLSAQYEEFAMLDDVLYFVNRGSDDRFTLWRTDGSDAGTWQVKSFPNDNERPFLLTAVAGKLEFLVARDHTSYFWSSDGTEAGTVQRGDGYHGWATSSFRHSIALGDRQLLYYAGDWFALDPPSTGFTVLEPADADLLPISPNSGYAAVAGSTFFFTAGTADSGAELWTTDGTREGTVLVKDIAAGIAGSQPGEMLAVGDDIYFAASDETHGRELWRSDGTPEGTVLVADVEPGAGGSHPSGLKQVGDKLYFHAQREGIGRELHVLDLPPAR